MWSFYIKDPVGVCSPDRRTNDSQITKAILAFVLRGSEFPYARARATMRLLSMLRNRHLWSCSKEVPLHRYFDVSTADRAIQCPSTSTGWLSRLYGHTGLLSIIFILLLLLLVKSFAKNNYHHHFILTNNIFS